MSGIRRLSVGVYQFNYRFFLLVPCRRAGIRADTPASSNRNTVPFYQCSRWLRHAAQSLLSNPGSKIGSYKNTQQLGLLLLSERDPRVRRHPPLVIGQSGQT